MQISDKVYLEIKVKGSDKERVVPYDNLRTFQLVETAGTSLPYIFFSFATFDKDLADLFIPNNEVIVSFGETKEKADTFKLHSVVNSKDTDPSNNSWTVSYGGFIGSNAYMMNEEVCKEYNGNSLLVAKQVIKEYAGGKSEIQTDIEKTNENQVVWRQVRKTPNMFLVETLLHMDIQPSFPLFAFDRYGTFHLRDFNKLKAGKPQWTFTPYTPTTEGEIQYLNNFNVDSFKSSYNLYSGYNKSTEIYRSVSGVPDSVINDNVPILASSKESEKYNSGNRVVLNKVQTDNVHNTYMEAYAHNTNCLMSLSSMLGGLRIFGYQNKIKPTDLAFVKMESSTASDRTLEGYYLVDTVVTTIETVGGNAKLISTLVYVTRDNKNNVENFVTEKKRKGLKIVKKLMQRLANEVSKARTVIATCSQLFDGTFTRACTSFVTATKVNLLRMFSVGGITTDFTSQANLLQSFLCQGNALMNVLMNMIFPSSISSVMRDFLIDRPSDRLLLSKYIAENVPFEIQGLISDLVDSLMNVHDTLNSIAADNGITAREIPQVPIADDSSFNVVENRVEEIFQEFENNTTGLDIPFPIIELTEEQKLLPTRELKELMASETIDNLTELGYLKGVDVPTFTDILLGKTPIDFNIINQINQNAGDKLYYRYWGTYGATNDALYAWSAKDNTIYTKTPELNIYTRLYNNDASPYMGEDFTLTEEEGKYFIAFTDILGETTLAERNENEDVISNALAQLTEFYIVKGYKDRYRTIPCTKLISATKNERLYFACPQSEENLKFYINSKRVILKSFPIDLGVRDPYGVKVIYNVYYTETGYNSNSTMLEIRQS